MYYMKKDTRSAQYLCDFPDLEFEMPHKYWDWAGWNLGHLYVVEYDQQDQQELEGNLKIVKTGVKRVGNDL